MRRSNHRRSTGHQCGFTLVEMLLVLAVMAAFASMAIPSVMRMFGQQKITGGAERVRETIAMARIFAIETGLNYLFCCQPNGTQYVVTPAEVDQAMPVAGSQSAPAMVFPRKMGALPDGTTFSGELVGAAANSPAANLSQATNPQGTNMMALSSMSSTAALPPGNWSQPIIFKPDGSALTDAEITISDTRSQQIRLHVRALTGAVSMDRLHVGKR